MEVTLTPFLKLTHRTGGAMVVRTDDIASIVPLAEGCRITLRNQTIHDCQEGSEDLAVILTGAPKQDKPAEKTPPKTNP